MGETCGFFSPQQPLFVCAVSQAVTGPGIGRPGFGPIMTAPSPYPFSQFLVDPTILFPGLRDGGGPFAGDEGREGHGSTVPPPVLAVPRVLCVCVCVCKARDQLYLKSRDIIRDQVSGMGLVDRSVAGARRVTMRGGGSRMSCHGELCVSVCA